MTTTSTAQLNLSRTASSSALSRSRMNKATIRIKSISNKAFVSRRIGRSFNERNFEFDFPNEETDEQNANANELRMKRCCEVADFMNGECAPHPKFACVVYEHQGRAETREAAETAVFEAYQFGQAGEKCERQIERRMNEDDWMKKNESEGKRYDVYLNMEPVHGIEVAGECESVLALAKMKNYVRTIYVGMVHPNKEFRGRAVRALVNEYGFRKEQVCVLAVNTRAAMFARKVNEALLYRCATGGYPLGVYKYAMTLDGKIASSSGKSKWVTGPESREIVFRERAKSDAVIVGGGTLRMDDPRLTSRNADGSLAHSYQPARVVLTASFDVPENARLWDTSVAATIVMTSKGKNPVLAKKLRDKGVDVVEFEGEFTMDKVLKEMSRRGWLQTFWECGGTLAAPAIKAGAFSRVLAFVAPKIVGGGSKAQTPMGDFGIDAMVDAVPLKATKAKVYGRDILITGYLPNAYSKGRLKQFVEGGWISGRRDGFVDVGESSDDSERVDTFGENELLADVEQCCADEYENNNNNNNNKQDEVISFYKSWDTYSAFSNFSSHGVNIDGEQWQTSESYYQAQKFDDSLAEGKTIRDQIRDANSPEKASRIGRMKQREHPNLMKKDWDLKKFEVMDRVLRVKFTQNHDAKSLLLSTGKKRLVEDSPVDSLWGCGRNGEGENLLGEALMRLREEFRTSIMKDFMVDELERMDEQDLTNISSSSPTCE